ncbi:coiled-coil domain-containing protein 93 isoform X2 [Phlebotomus papatasi]|uniref:coiled-coil domain-containing protein 93 isoform X2 n=1 Tax=Phlebotomus papatasi TaxID=29031 RepID=UPI0024845DC7|nr:coiled-coil domain-containing protein 93 isoform X2 [Phlebotomus papatasi]
MSGKDIFSKHLPNINLATRFDAEGREIQVERREDEEQNLKQQEIFDILVAAGYFRARIKGLSAFDKIVGGMVWCMEACDFDVDVDLLFSENLTIGQKIALTEKIVAVLPKMSCPHLIEPHQIQGLDFINIFPVIQWLVKRSVENRAERAEKLKSFAVGQFHNHFKLQVDKVAKEKNTKVLENIEKIQNLYAPRREFKKKSSAGSSEDELTRVRITLLEFGDKGRLLATNRQKSTEKSLSTEEMEEKASEVDEDDYLEFSQLSEADREKIKQNYEELKSEFSIDSQELSQQNQIKALLVTKQSLERKLAKIEGGNSELSDALKQLKEQINTLVQEEEETSAEIADLIRREEESDTSVLETVKELVLQNDALKQEEVEFKEKCRKELVELQQKISDQENKSPDKEETAIRSELEAEKQRLQALRLQLAKQNRAIVTLQRQLDAIPDRTELAQYQRRFLELYNQVSAKHRETKHFYTLYNTLGDTKMYLTKELELLNSIYENYSATQNSSTSRAQFLKQFESLAEGIRQMKIKIKNKCDDEKVKRDGYNEQLLILIDQQRKLANAVKQLQLECKKNDDLQEKLNSLS